ncbi:MAG: AMIN domain-containing protein [Campylobacter sp.]
MRKFWYLSAVLAASAVARENPFLPTGELNSSVMTSNPQEQRKLFDKQEIKFGDTGLLLDIVLRYRASDGTIKERVISDVNETINSDDEYVLQKAQPRPQTAAPAQKSAQPTFAPNQNFGKPDKGAKPPVAVAVPQETQLNFDVQKDKKAKNQNAAAQNKIAEKQATSKNAAAKNLESAQKPTVAEPASQETPAESAAAQKPVEQAPAATEQIRASVAANAAEPSDKNATSEANQSLAVAVNNEGKILENRLKTIDKDEIRMDANSPKAVDEAPTAQPTMQSEAAAPENLTAKTAEQNAAKNSRDFAVKLKSFGGKHATPSLKFQIEGKSIKILTKSANIKHFTAEEGNKIALDFTAAPGAFQTKVVAFNEDVFKSATIGWHKNYYRIAIVTDKTRGYSVQKINGGYELIVK